MRAGIAYIRGDRFVRRAIITPLLFGAAFPLVFASFPVIAFRDYHHNPRVAGLLLAAYGGGSVGRVVRDLRGARPLQGDNAWTPPASARGAVLAPRPARAARVMVAAMAIVGFGTRWRTRHLGILTHASQQPLPEVRRRHLLDDRWFCPGGSRGVRVLSLAARCRHASSRSRVRPRAAARLRQSARAIEPRAVPKKRLDVLLVERGLAESRAQAQALVHRRARARPLRSRASRWTRTPSSTSRRRRRTSRARATSSRTRSMRSAIDVAGLDCLDVGARPAASPTCSCSAAPRA